MRLGELQDFRLKTSQSLGVNLIFPLRGATLQKEAWA